MQDFRIQIMHICCKGFHELPQDVTMSHLDYILQSASLQIIFKF